MDMDEYEELMHRASEQATAMSREAAPTCKDCPKPNTDVFFAHRFGVYLCVVCWAHRAAAPAIRRRSAQAHWAQLI